MAELFQATEQNISLHLKNIREDGELDPESTVKESLSVRTQRKREVQRTVMLYKRYAALEDDADLKALEEKLKNRPGS